MVAATGPDLVEDTADDRPLPAMVGERGRALRAQAIVLARAAAGQLPPFRVDVAETLEPVQEGVEHAVAPLELTARELGDALQDRVAVRLALGEDAGATGVAAAATRSLPMRMPTPIVADPWS